ncbi:MAG TPA: M14 family zinc carboxypeptidase [Pyrinomonadaceae bacterium]|nr:M14 family zinc carboxypeptidase [Pyrinomonadaceae bacterium]
MYRTVAQLDMVMNTLGTDFPELCTRVEMPNRSVQGRPIHALRFHAGTATGRRGVLIVGGVHGRELMNPDAIVDLMIELILAYTANQDITLGGKTWRARELKIMMNTLDIWLLPCANPDGREHAMNVDEMWRQNRRDNPGTSCEGVDVNRNHDIVWGVTTPFTSCSPCNETYVGPDRFSEPETRNIRDLCDAHRIDVFLDVHSFTGLVLYPWGHAHTQTTDPTQRFTTLATATCASLTPPAHLEYMLPRDQLRFQTVAAKIAADIHAVNGRSYTPTSIRGLYAATGTSTDYVYSRHIADPALRKTYGFGFETGLPILRPDGSVNLPESFHPANPEPTKIETRSGIISLLFQSICAIEFIGTTLSGSGSGRTLQKLRDVRDQRLATTDAGRKLIALFERVQIPLLGLILADKPLTKEAMSLLDTSLKLLENEEAKVPTRELERGLAFLDSLANRTTSKTLRRDLDTIRKQVKSSGNKTVAKALKQLLKS